jgi:hypothetical protein
MLTKSKWNMGALTQSAAATSISVYRSVASTPQTRGALRSIPNALETRPVRLISLMKSSLLNSWYRGWYFFHCALDVKNS